MPALGSLTVSVRTTGSHLDFNGYELVVGTDRRKRVTANEDVFIAGVSPGTYLVAFQDVAANCSVKGTHPTTATVVAGRVVGIAFEIHCAYVERIGDIAYVLDSVATGYSAAWIAVANPAQSKAVALVEGLSPNWSPDGDRLVFSDGSGRLVHMDPEMRDSTRLGAAGLASEPAWSPRGDGIAFIRPNDPGIELNNRLYLLKLDGSPAVEIPTPGVISVSNPAWSPDGQRIAFTCAVRTGTYDVCVIHRSGTGFVQLTREGQLNDHPAWSPDGSKIAFTTTRFQSPSGGDVALMAVDGTGITRVTSGSEAAWSPSVSKLVLVGPAGDGLFTVNPDGSNLTRLTTGRHRSPTWRPVDPCYGCWDY